MEPLILAKLFQKLQNLPKFCVPEETSNSEQVLELDSPRKVDLPDEIWLKIIQKLPTEDMFGCFALACKKFHNLSQDSMAVKFLQLNRIDNGLMLVNVREAIKRQKGILELIIKEGIGNYMYVNELICHVLRYSPNLKSLKIKTKELSAGTIEMILKSKIQILTVEGIEKFGSDGIIDEVCNIKTLKSLTIYQKEGTDQFLKTLAENDVPIEEIRLFSSKACSNPAVLNTFFKQKKYTLKRIALRLDPFFGHGAIPLENLNLCQNLEEMELRMWDSKNLEVLSGMPNLKRLVLGYSFAREDFLVKLFKRLSLENLTSLSIQNNPSIKDELVMKLPGVAFPKLEFLHIHPKIDFRKADDILFDKSLKELVSNMPNLRFIQFGYNFFKSNFTFKTLMELFEKRKIFSIFNQIHSQVSMERWFLTHNKDLYEKYQNLKFSFYRRLEG